MGQPRFRLVSDRMFTKSTFAQRWYTRIRIKACVWFPAGEICGGFIGVCLSSAEDSLEDWFLLSLRKLQHSLLCRFFTSNRPLPQHISSKVACPGRLHFFWRSSAVRSAYLTSIASIVQNSHGLTGLAGELYQPGHRDIS